MPSTPLLCRGIVSGLVAAMLSTSAMNAQAQSASSEGTPELFPFLIAPGGEIILTPGNKIPAPEPISAPSFDSILPDSREKCTTAPVCFNDAKLNFNYGNFETAATFFLHTYDLAPEGNTRSILLFNAAVAYEHAGLPDNAIQFYKTYLSEVPNAPNKTTLRNRFSALERYARGLAFLDRDKTELALTELSRVQRDLGSTNPPASLCGDIASAYEKLGNPEEALRRYQGCLGLAPPAVKRALEEKIAVLTPSPSVTQLEGLDFVDDSAPRTPSSYENPSFLSRHTWSLVTGGFGVAALGIGIGLNYAGKAQFEEMARGCGQTSSGCSQRDIDGLKAYFTGRNITYATGSIAIIAGVTMFIAESLNNPKSPQDEKLSVQFSPDGTLALRY